MANGNEIQLWCVKLGRKRTWFSSKGAADEHTRMLEGMGLYPMKPKFIPFPTGKQAVVDFLNSNFHYI